MIERINICGVDPVANDEPTTAYELAQTLAACVVPVEFQSGTVASEIDEVALSFLADEDLCERFAKFDSNERTYYQLDGDLVAVHWPAAQVVEAGSIRQIGRQWLSEFIVHIRD